MNKILTDNWHLYPPLSDPLSYEIRFQMASFFKKELLLYLALLDT